MAPNDAPQSYEASPEGAITFDGCYGIFGACRIKTARSGEIGRYGYLVKSYEKNKRFFRKFHKVLIFFE
jgi:hypothetical protein